MSPAAGRSTAGNAAITMTLRLVPTLSHAFSVVLTTDSTSRQYLAYLQEMQIQQLQHESNLI